MEKIVASILAARSIVLSTHRHPDGDGLGCQVALFWALKKAGKKVRILNVDELPRKYDFLNHHLSFQCLEEKHDQLENTDLAIIFDTNDKKLLGPLWEELETKCEKVLFIDHHPELDDSPVHPDSFVDTSASSTGQLVFTVIKALGIALDEKIALGLYTSIVFDTHNFRYIRSNPTPHLIAAELLRFPIDVQMVHGHLFGNHTQNKIQFLAEVLTQIQYEFNGKLAWIKVKKAHMDQLGLEMDETRDIIDILMNISGLEAAALFREEEDRSYKISFRSRGNFPVNQIAVKLGGGGHLYASGAYVYKPFDQILDQVLKSFSELFKKSA